MPDWSKDLCFGFLCYGCFCKNISPCLSCQIICWKEYQHKILKGVDWTLDYHGAIRTGNGMERIQVEVLERPHLPQPELTMKINKGSKGVVSVLRSHIFS